MADEDVWTALLNSSGAGFSSLLCSEPATTVTAGTTGRHQAVAHQALGLRPRPNEVVREPRSTGTTQHAALSRFEQLTTDQAMVLRALADGRTVGQIADGWHVHESIVRSQVRGVLCALGVTTQLEAVATARLAGWTSA